MSLDDTPVTEPSHKRAKTERKGMDGVNGIKGSPQAPLERVTEALFSASVEAKVWSVATRALGTLNPPILYPEYTDGSGNYVYRTLDFWTSGFFPGSLYLLLERAIQYPQYKPLSPDGKSQIRPHQLQLEHLCRWWTANLHQNALKRDTHDLGFMIAPWAMKSWEIHRDPAAFNTLIMAAHSLASRFNATTQCLRSWDVCITQKYKFTDPSRDFLVIIDNMLNLDLLFWAAKETSNRALYDMAQAHAHTTRKHHIREDKSTFHVINFDAETGGVKSRFTNQGYSDDSCWARGQAWGILGFMQTYEWTQDSVFLNTARDLAKYFIAHLPADGVPYWDLTAPVTETSPRDTSAAMVAACGLLLLYKALKGGIEADNYLQEAFQLVNAVVHTNMSRQTLQFGVTHPALQVAVYPEGYIDECASDGFDLLCVSQSFNSIVNCETILDGATINNYEFAPRRWSNHGLVYADYYFLLFGNMLLRMGLTDLSGHE
ncbi:hypothetical protein N7522_006578 [Penicillium canescens]|uniref:Glucuronyl hydrolase n=1 Tax=Penicillium canescens TaxID=5083 RepID=A0AAD6I990_PENCN|nr:uncharacterized protein N7446_010372 [Penicillium canescens]KAJ6001351.1 hypothetical protein N7522_006578 [Penicillium canescens]KAJ6035610.1 hypothetical protein N7460_009785 [Penicillium canescens]KAJ6037733.1 hypothetical protein N7444_010438 [Penicillium canescens]KAJ6054360.1 hypothetical protein N7446_010372 [Penicillium canescens]